VELAGLRALLVSPEGADDDGDAPGIVLVHGAAGLDRATRELAERLGAHGFCVLAPDLCSRGEADPADRRALQDLDAAARFLGQREEVDARSLAVVGTGRGGTLAFLAGCTSTRFSCVVDRDGPVLYPELSEARPIQPIELLLNLDRPLLALFSTGDTTLLEQHLADANKDFELARCPVEEHEPRTLCFLRERM